MTRLDDDEHGAILTGVMAGGSYADRSGCRHVHEEVRAVTSADLQIDRQLVHVRWRSRRRARCLERVLRATRAAASLGARVRCKHLNQTMA